jgi:hypothetical protein
MCMEGGSGADAEGKLVSLLLQVNWLSESVRGIVISSGTLVISEKANYVSKEEIVDLPQCFSECEVIVRKTDKAV